VPDKINTDTTLYNLYIIEFGEMAALFMVRDGRVLPVINANGLYVEKSEDHIQEYSDQTLIGIIADDLGMDEEYLRSFLLPMVMQPTDTNNIYKRSAVIGTICVSLALICAFLSFALPRMSRFKKNSKLGKQISRCEDFELVELKIKEQMKNPVFCNDFIAVTKDYIIGESGEVNRNEVGFWYTNQLTDVEIEEDSVYDDGETRYRVTLYTDDEWFRFLTFEIDAFDDIMEDNL